MNSARSLAMRSRCSLSSAVVSALLTDATANPISTSLSVWSFISEMSGDTTSVVPRSSSAGIW